MPRFWCCALVVSLAGAIWCDGASGQVIRVGIEFQVNSYTAGGERVPVIALDATDRFVVAWEGSHDGDATGIFARRYSSAGAAVGPEFQVNAYTTGQQRWPAVAAEDDGDFVIVWRSHHDGDGYAVFARRFNSTGTALATEFQVSLFTTGHQEEPAVAIDGDGDFVMVWSGAGPTDDQGVFARRFSSAGVAFGGEFQVNQHSASLKLLPRLAVAPDGDFVVAWTSVQQDGDGNGVFARRFDASGAAQGNEFQVSTYTDNSQIEPVLATDQAGNFVIAWDDDGGPGVSSIEARRFASGGERVGSQLRVGLENEAVGAPTIGMNAAGGFVIAWAAGMAQDGSGTGVFARRFNTAGAAVGGEFQVNTFTANGQSSPGLGMSPDGLFVVVWESSLGQDGNYDGVFAQRFTTPLAILDVDADGSTDALTDGLLCLRFLFGFTGPTLVNGAVDLVNCRRCSGAAITGYLEGLDLDIDGDNETSPLTDGLLVLRFLFGFTGPTLINGAVDEMFCTRCTAFQLDAHLKSLL